MNDKDKIKQIFDELAKVLVVIRPFRAIFFGYIDYSMTETEAMFICDCLAKVLEK